MSDNPEYCIECGKPSTTLVMWASLEGPYGMCDFDTWHSVKNRNGLNMGPYSRERFDMITEKKELMRGTLTHQERVEALTELMPTCTEGNE